MGGHSPSLSFNILVKINRFRERFSLPDLALVWVEVEAALAEPQAKNVVKGRDSAATDELVANLRSRVCVVLVVSLPRSLYICIYISMYLCCTSIHKDLEAGNLHELTLVLS